MKTIFHALEEKILQQFIETKRELLEIAAGMSAKERAEGRVEIMEAATLFDIPEDMTDFSELYSINADGSAIIPISGKLTPKADICDGFFSDCTTYSFIQAAALAADDDPNVSEIEFHISSGGGYVTGVDATGQVIAGLRKKTRGVVSGMAASAAYWLASQMDEIVVSAPTDFVGSIGVAVEYVDIRKMEEAQGVTRIILTSTDAPDKRIDMATIEGQKKIVEELDAIHEVFASRVSFGRKVSIEKINNDFGQGGLVIASKAKKAGMIDSINNEISGASVPVIKSPAAAGKPKEEAASMKSLKELLAENPNAQTEHDNLVTEARAEGETAGTERGIKTGREEMQAVYAVAMPILSSEHYPEAMKKRVGEKAQDGDIDGVKDYVSMFDSTTEGAATAKAIAEQAAETPPASPAPESEKAETDFQARLAANGRADK